MKIFKCVAIALMLVIGIKAKAQSNDFDVFLKKFERYAETHSPKIRWTMPIAKPEVSHKAMPDAFDSSEASMQDPETGLRYYPGLHKVYDPVTRYYIEYDPESIYHVETVSGKIYKGESEVNVERQKDNSSG